MHFTLMCSLGQIGHGFFVCYDRHRLCVGYRVAFDAGEFGGELFTGRLGRLGHESYIERQSRLPRIHGWSSFNPVRDPHVPNALQGIVSTGSLDEVDGL